MRKQELPPEKGDLVRVEWVDIFEHVNGDPDDAHLAKRTSFGLFWSFIDDDGVECLVTTTTIDGEDQTPGQNGYCIYPRGCVKELKVIKRARRPRARRSKEPVQDSPSAQGEEGSRIE